MPFSLIVVTIILPTIFLNNSLAINFIFNMLNNTNCNSRGLVEDWFSSCVFHATHSSFLSHRSPFSPMYIFIELTVFQPVASHACHNVWQRNNLAVTLGPGKTCLLSVTISSAPCECDSVSFSAFTLSQLIFFLVKRYNLLYHDSLICLPFSKMYTIVVWLTGSNLLLNHVLSS